MLRRKIDLPDCSLYYISMPVSSDIEVLVELRVVSGWAYGVSYAFSFGVYR